VLTRTAPAELAGNPAADRAGEELGLAGLFGGGVEEAPVLGKTAARLRHRQVQARQLGGGRAQDLQRGRQVRREPSVHLRKCVFDELAPPRTPGLRGVQGERQQPLPAAALEPLCVPSIEVGCIMMPHDLSVKAQTAGTDYQKEIPV
jgi:hypothetical protein